MKRFIKLTLLVFPLAVGVSCASTEEKLDDGVVIIEEDSGESNFQSKKEPAVSIGNESVNQSIKACGIKTLPDAFLGGGLIFLISNPITPIVALGYYGGHYYLCFDERQAARPSLDTKELVEEARQKTAEELRKSFQQVRDKLESKTEDVSKEIIKIEKRLKELGEMEREAIEKTGSKVLRELYEQLDAIRHADIEIKEIEVEEFIPNHRSSVEEN